MNITSEYTKDCPRDDCRISFRGGTSTLMGWYPSYDKHGNDVSGGDPNIYTSDARCYSCGKHWVSKTRYGKTTITEIVA